MTYLAEQSASKG